MNTNWSAAVVGFALGLQLMYLWGPQRDDTRPAVSPIAQAATSSALSAEEKSALAMGVLAFQALANHGLIVKTPDGNLVATKPAPVQAATP